jgi:uncharacterized membrane protein YdjX (TVP38/TMEM64 family)
MAKNRQSAGGDESKKARRKAGDWNAIARYAPLVLILAAVVAALTHYKDVSVESIVNAAPRNTALAVIILLGLYAVKSVTVVFYLKILYAAAGLLFPLPLALAVNVAGTAIDFSIPYWVGRHSGADAAKKLLEKYPKLQKLRDLRGKSDFLFAMLARAIGIISADPLSMYFGAVGMPYSKFLLGGLTGMIPAIVLATVLGDAARKPGSPQFWWAVGIYAFVLAVSFTAFFIWKKKNKT